MDLAVQDVRQIVRQAGSFHTVRPRHDALEALRFAAQRGTDMGLVQRKQLRSEKVDQRSAYQAVCVNTVSVRSSHLDEGPPLAIAAA
jgi:hypothetical protein